MGLEGYHRPPRPPVARGRIDVKTEEVEGIGATFAQSLSAAGVGSTDALLKRRRRLARRNAANLAITFQELDAARPNTVRRVPSETTIAGWIAQAAKLDKVVSH